MIKTMQSKTKELLSEWYGSNFMLMIESLVIGVLTGFVVVGFRKAIEYVTFGRMRLYAILETKGIWYFLLWIFAVVIIAYLLGLMSKLYPMIKGSGIPQLKGSFLHRLELKTWPELPLKIITGAVGIGMGMSLGREGPSVQIGGYVGDAWEKIGKRTPMERIFLVTSGAAAGLAAAFNAPLAGAVFALEELHKHFNPILLICVMIASVSGDFIAGHFFGVGAVFKFNDLSILPLKYFPWLILLGIIITIVGDIFKRGLYLSQDLFDKSKIPVAFRPIIPMLVAVPIAIFLTDASGGGHTLIEKLASQEYSFSLLLVILVVKLIFTGLCYGSGSSGGIFLPLLACGALTGIIVSKALVHFQMLEPLYTLNFMIFGMAACFSAVVKAPLTGAILLLEMSGKLTHLGGLVFTCAIAFAFSTLIKSLPVYEVLLDRLLAKSKNEAEKSANKTKKEIAELSVNPGSQLDEKLVKEIVWPKHCLIVGIGRGEEEFIPNGNTKIYAGDRLIILTDEDAMRETIAALMLLAGIS
ncbi:ClC family H(+)/Cl(-) exchange transporter [Treponema phagedenis]|uniref:Chloride transporter, ClC family n=2 Tax=Treponema phagedenis TaxID=162 RepID=A0A0B7GUF3_TREPH|nr:ClC family H(+)/Cl(-) exchange transporter [Treponema phagedenis]NVP24454.1 ClC family H(+)/Cl(-) exchange transporter [Treponema phagedenis]QEJ95473.1 ClC family H(+)/Cl(-) exchange transporter [Treponema phagedenis]QEJ97788.1 ClC family H(+)/Cl(-) exchange transporter [Treponema phagedenis]QEK01326.1 ClC family H(+)/Cl(-) exchange transporter [Treponema phagedenis]QEK03354.1 ClC family H(+)/Cl(-) exchange transporter [Treponema phagedenis]